VLDSDGQVIPAITPHNVAEIAAALRGSRGTDVTGGMAAKVYSMLDLAQQQPGLRIRIFSGLAVNHVKQILLQPDTAVGTLLTDDK
jgi:isopentenyl phosphate kinase